MHSSTARKRSYNRWLSVFILLATCAQPVRAAQLLWTNLNGGLWNAATNWSPNQVPGAADSVVITNAGTYTVTNNASVTISAIVLGLDPGTNPPVVFPQLRHLAGTFTVTNFSVATNAVVTMASALTIVNSLDCAGRVDQTSSTLWLQNTGAINLYNLSGGDQRGGMLTVTNFNWSAGNLNADGAGQKVIVASGGVLNFTGAADRALSYYSLPGRGLDNYGTFNWTGPGNLRGNGGAVLNNYGAVNLSTNAQFNWAGSGASPTWNNFGAITKTGGTDYFYFNQVALNNSGSITINSGSLSIYSTTYSGAGSITVFGAQLQFYASTATNNGIFSVASGSLLTVDAGGTLGFGPASSLSVPGTNNLRFNSGTTYLNTTNVSAPSAWIAGGVLVQMADNQFPAINQSAGTLQLTVPSYLSVYNLTNGELRGRDLTVTNFNWYAGNQNSRAPGESIAGPADRTIIPAGGTLNILGTANRAFSYYTAPGRGLDNFGTINWSAPIQLQGNGGSVVNNYGAVNVTAGSPNVQYGFAGSGANPVWNNFGTLTRSANSTPFYFNAVYLNNSGTMDIQTGTLSIYASTATNLTGGVINMAGGTTFLSENSSSLTLAPSSVLTHPNVNGIQLVSGNVFIATTNLTTPALWLNGAAVYQQTNVNVATINESAGVWQLAVPCYLANYNFTNGELRGRDLTVTNFNWYAGNQNSRAPSESIAGPADRTIIPAGGTLNILGTANRAFSYYAAPGRGLDNFGTINWSAPMVLQGNGGSVVNNYGAVNVTAGSPNVQYGFAGSGANPVWNNFGTLTRSANSTPFYFNAVYLNNSGFLDVQTGTLSIYNSTFTNSSGWISLSAAAVLQSENTSVVALGTPGRVVAPTADSIRLGGTSCVIETTNIVSPTLWQQAGTLYQRTNIVVATINESGGAIQFDVPCTLNQLNQTNGDVQGRNLTVTNWNWYAGNHYRGTSGVNTNDDRTIIPAGGTLNLLGTTARYFTYYSASGPGRTLDNFGAINWSGAAVFYSYGLLNNYGTTTVSAVGSPQYAANAASVPPTWNNYGTFTRSAGTYFYFNDVYLNNSGLMDIQQGTLSIYNSTFTNSSGWISLSAAAVLQSENTSVVTLGTPGRVVAPTADSIRLGGTSCVIETTNIVSPTLWQQAGTLYQRTNIVVATINESGGAIQFDVPCTLNQLNQTNGDVQGRNLTVTNWNWYAGSHYRGTSGVNTNDDRTIIPAGGTLNLLGTTARYFTYYSASGPGRTLDNFGAINWSGAAVFYSYGLLNNYGTTTVSAVGSPQYAANAASVPPTWNNYGTFTRSAGTYFYFNDVYLNNSGLMDIQQGTLSIYNSAFTNFAGGSVMTQLGAILANDNTSVSSFEPGSSVACASTNAFQVNSGTVGLATTSVTAPSIWINGGTLTQNTNAAVATINESAGTWQLNVPAGIDSYNLTNGDLRGANLTLNKMNWLGGVLYAANASNNLVTVNSQLNISGATAKTMSYLAGQPGRSIINNGTATWGGASITGQGGATIQNSGTLNLTNDIGLAWGGSGNVSVLQNNGTFTKSGGTGVAAFSSTAFTNSGTVNISSGGIQIGGPFTQTTGSAFLGTNFTASSTVNVLAGSLSGKGSIAGAFYNNGQLNPGASPGYMNGASFTNSAAGVYNVEIGGNTGAGTNYDQLRFSGPVTLGGTLNVSLYNNYALILSNRFTVLTTSARTGTFASVVPPPGVTINTIYGTTNVVLEIAGLTNAPLQVLTNLISQTIWTPDPVTFSATVSGVTPISYQWQFNGTNIVGANSPTYTIPAVAVTNAGLYTLQVTDGYGGTTNVSATLTVIPFANVITWTNIAGGNWSAPANWVPARVPNGTNIVVIVTNGTYTVMVDVPAALSNLTVGAVGATGTPTVNLLSGQSLTVNGNTTWETNTVLALNGLLQMNGGSNNVRGHVDWQLGTLAGAGRTVIASNASLTFVGSLNQKFIVTNVLENYGTFNYGNDSFGNAQGLRFSGGAQLTNYASGVISIASAAYDYSGAQTPRSYLVNYGTINASGAGIYSPTYISIDFINYGTLQDNGYCYLARGTNYGTFSFANALCEVSIFGDPTTGEYFSFEPGTSLTGPRPNINCGGPVQWKAASAVHNGRLYIGSGSGGATYPNAEFKVLANYTNTYQVLLQRGAFTVNNPALTTELRNFADGAASTWSFVITNAGTMNADNLSHAYFGFNNSGSILVRSNLTLAISSLTYGGGTISIAATASATFSGGTVDAQTVLNRGTNSVTGGMGFTGNTFYRNYAGARTYFGGGSFVTGPAALLNEGLLDGFGGLAINTTNRNTVLADDAAGRNLALGNYVQESGLTELNPGQVSGTLEILGGQLTGTNTITGSVHNYANCAPGQPFGLLSVTGNFTNNAAATYLLPISGVSAMTNFPQTRVQGTSYLAGTLSVNFTNGFTPAPGNLFTAMVFTARSGVFDAIVNDTYGLEAFYTATTLVLRAENLLPNVSLTVSGGTTQLVCQPFRITATATDPDGVVTNLVISINGGIGASQGGVNLNGSPLKTMADSDFPTQITIAAQATDDRNGTRTVSLPVTIYNYAETNRLFLGGVRTNDFKLCLVGEPGRNYEVYGITNLTTTNWVDLGTMTQSNGTWRYLDQTTMTNRNYRFYRTQQLP